MKRKTVLLLSLLLVFSCDWNKEEKKTKVEEKKPPIVEIQERLSSIVEKATPGIVTIFTYSSKEEPPVAFNAGDEEAFSENESLGSGFVYKEDNDFMYILTNGHVIEKSENIVVKFYNGVEEKGKIAGIDQKSDLAVLKIKKDEKISHIKPLPLGSTENLKVGYFVIAGGSPYNLGHTFTFGIISALHRNLGISTYENYIQTDAAINPGDSGGPLLDINGRVIGVNTAIIQSGQGLGFAIPIDEAKSVADELIKYGKVKRGWLGVIVQDLTPKLKKKLNVKIGVYIVKVLKNSPAYKIGLKKGDVILSVNGKQIKNSQDIKYMLAKRKPDTEIVIKIYRKGKIFEKKAVLGEMLDKGI